MTKSGHERAKRVRDRQLAQQVELLTACACEYPIKRYRNNPVTARRATVNHAPRSPSTSVTVRSARRERTTPFSHAERSISTTWTAGT